MGLLLIYILNDQSCICQIEMNFNLAKIASSSVLAMTAVKDCFVIKNWTFENFTLNMQDTMSFFKLLLVKF